MRRNKGRKGFVAIKVDLEKAYDRLNWGILRDTLREVGLNEALVELISVCVSSPSMNVLFNGERTQDFLPSREIRQDDPLSPYLFVLCVERLGHLIQHAVEEGTWKLIQLSPGGL